MSSNFHHMSSDFWPQWSGKIWAMNLSLDKRIDACFILKGCAVENLPSKNTNWSLACYNILKGFFWLERENLLWILWMRCQNSPNLGENVSVSEVSEHTNTTKCSSSLGSYIHKPQPWLIAWRTRCHTTSVLQILWLTQTFEKKKNHRNLRKSCEIHAVPIWNICIYSCVSLVDFHGLSM